jgi:phosphoribosylglycinamide formyltransferase-1
MESGAMMERKLPIAVLISGGGTTLRNLLRRVDAGTLDVQIKLVVSSSSQAKGLQFAADAAVPSRVIRTRDFPTTQAFSDEIFNACRAAGAELVVLGGFLKHLLIPADFHNRVTNIHPALVPAFCGKGYYGMHVHESALEYGVKVSGCTIHFVDNQYDHGPIILQRVVPVLEGDTPHDLAARVFEAECDAYPQVLQWIAEGRVEVDGRRVRVRRDG